MKGTIIDYNDFEALVVLEDDSVVNVPLSKVSDYLSKGTSVSLNYNDISCSTSNRAKFNKNKIADFL
ncbi:hypothetical protein [Clostridium sp.]|uniref:hypothetical protein n=1 Tax=Clostridium sp. TaxID=1506 RepID=UPI00262F101F|nr:hypothetical protein [Clostridium sp.]